MKKIELIEGFSARAYQQAIFANTLDKNSLVVLPTGLGKTVIAMMLAVFYFNKSNKKIIFLAPTKPLVEQQENSFKSFFKNSDEFGFQVLTGQVSPTKRKVLYDKNDFIFSTPQLVENDLVNGLINSKNFGFLVVDEAHRATGNYAYCFIAEQFDKTKCKILGLSASPGTSKDEIREIMNNLKIEHVEVKKYDDTDVLPYVNKTVIKPVKVALSEEFKEIRKKLEIVYLDKIRFLKEIGFLQGKSLMQVSKRDLLDIQTQLRLSVSYGEADENIWKAISVSAGLMKLSHGIELFESQQVSGAYEYFYNFFRDGKDNSKAVAELVLDINFREVFEEISKLQKAGVLHPKMHKLKEIVNQNILNEKDLKIIIFNQYRQSAQEVVKELSKIKEIKPALFIGQAKKGDVKFSQKDQKMILEKFRNGEYNVLVSTSVGEEGLDIPKVDLVIFYEPVPSAIRTIQRIGRTGRYKKGNACVLMSEGTRDIVVRHIANAKEKRMYKAFDELKKESEKVIDKDKEQGLNKFIGKNEEEDKDEIEKIKTDVGGDSRRILVYVDNRENNDLIKELFRLDEINVKATKLDVADIVISEHIAIERKSKKDFVNSIIDKRLFPQLMDLTRNYKRPVLILEGVENIFTIRNLNANAIRSSLSAIAIDLRIPIMFTYSIKESAQMILTIAKRTLRVKKDISLVAEKSSFSEDEEMEKFVSSIPKINVVNAKGLLNHFKSIEKLVNATEKDLLECSGIGKGRAKFLVAFFRREYKRE